MNEMKEKPTSVILIADAEPHLEGKGNMVTAHNKKLETDYKEQAKLFKEKKIPVYCFYMTDGEALVRTFKEIAEITEGKACKLDQAEALVQVVCESCLLDIVGQEGVNLYRKTYSS